MPKLYTHKEVAAALCIHPDSLRRKLRRFGIIPSFPSAPGHRYTDEDVERLRAAMVRHYEDLRKLFTHEKSL